MENITLGALAKGATPRIYIDRTALTEDMLDESCDKFYWKKVS